MISLLCFCSCVERFLSVEILCVYIYICIFVFVIFDERNVHVRGICFALRIFAYKERKFIEYSKVYIVVLRDILWSNLQDASSLLSSRASRATVLLTFLSHTYFARYFISKLYLVNCILPLSSLSIILFIYNFIFNSNRSFYYSKLWK